MEGIIKNKWVKLGLSLSTIIYAFIIIELAYSTFAYHLVITNIIAFSVLYIIMNILFFGIMFLSRKEIVTSIVSMILLPFLFAILVLNFGNWILFIPPFLIAVFMFFACNTHETIKTILGTIYLLTYILGIIAFFLVKTMFSGKTETTNLTANISKNSSLWQVYSQSVVEDATKNNISPDGKFRFYITDVKDSSSGSVGIYVEPNDKDKKYRFFTLYDTGREKRVASVRARGDAYVPKVKWVSSDRIEYQFGQDPAKQTKVRVEPKDYFEFLNG